MANKYGVQLEIRTMSDLVAHDEYIRLIAEGKHSVVMTMGFYEIGQADLAERYERFISPGAPSILRRNNAVEKLREHGVSVQVKNPSLTSLNKAQRKEFEKRTGSTVAYWIGEGK